YPSTYEGFGFPPLEAMACGTPVILSSGGSLREVAGDPALLVDPESVHQLYVAMRRVLDDESLRARMTIEGLRHAALFSWDDCVKRTVDVYESVVFTDEQR